jgi:hypothetical protein
VSGGDWATVVLAGLASLTSIASALVVAFKLGGAAQVQANHGKALEDHEGRIRKLELEPLASNSTNNAHAG